MRQVVTEGIILSRINYGEADRILTVLTPDHGKLRLMAKGVRREKSKLAGGIELFSISHITYVPGKGEIGSLISTRLKKHYTNIVKDLDRTMLGHELIKLLNKVTEDHTELEYFNLIKQAFEVLYDESISHDLVRFWFTARLLSLAGHAPNLFTDLTGAKLESDRTYVFDVEGMNFVPSEVGDFAAPSIKFLRLAFAGHTPRTLQAVQDWSTVLAVCDPPISRAIRVYLI
jgi:DNA repair protein RecO (recombination protein O)